MRDGVTEIDLRHIEQEKVEKRIRDRVASSGNGTAGDYIRQDHMTIHDENTNKALKFFLQHRLRKSKRPIAANLRKAFMRTEPVFGFFDSAVDWRPMNSDRIGKAFLYQQKGQRMINYTAIKNRLTVSLLTMRSNGATYSYEAWKNGEFLIPCDILVKWSKSFLLC